LQKYNLPLSIEPEINNSIKKNIESNLENFTSFEHTQPVIEYLNNKDIFMGIGTDYQEIALNDFFPI
jgi:hypothetical protein